MKKILLLVFAISLFLSCSPQPFYLTVDRKNNVKDVFLYSSSTSVFGVLDDSLPKVDSAVLSQLAKGVATKIEEDKQIPVGSISKSIVSKDAYLNKDFGDFNSAIIIDNFSFGNLEAKKFTKTSEYNLNPVVLILPYKADFKVFDIPLNNFVYQKSVIDTINLEIISSDISSVKFDKLISTKMPEICSLIGSQLASGISQQWETEERLLIYFATSEKWTEPCLLAQDFKLNKAIEKWLPFTSSNNNKKAAFAAYNIAVCCDLLGNKQLAKTWISFSINRYKFLEAIQMYEYLFKTKYK